MKYGKSWNLIKYNSSIPIGMRTVRIMIGANMRNTSLCCAIDDVNFNIFQNNQMNLTYV